MKRDQNCSNTASLAKFLSWNVNKKPPKLTFWPNSYRAKWTKYLKTDILEKFLLWPGTFWPRMLKNDVSPNSPPPQDIRILRRSRWDSGWRLITTPPFLLKTLVMAESPNDKVHKRQSPQMAKYTSGRGPRHLLSTSLCRLSRLPTSLWCRLACGGGEILQK